MSNTKQRNNLEQVRYKIAGETKAMLLEAAFKTRRKQWQVVKDALVHFIGCANCKEVPALEPILQATAEDVSVKTHPKRLTPELYKRFLQACERLGVPAGPALNWALKDILKQPK